MAAMACTLANAVDKSLSRHTAREKEYAECIKRLGGVEKPAKCFAIVVEALERNPDQDFLGKLYMSLELGNHWKGQFFTPYNVCRCMAETSSVCMKTAQNNICVGWVASQADMLAEDWVFA